MASNRSILRLAAAVLIIGAATAAYTLRPAADTAAPAETATAVDQSENLSANLPRLLDLGADKCVPCKMMAPILEELKVEFDGVFAVEFLDVWKDPSAARPYGIRVIPTQIFFGRDGAELFRHEGFYSREDILAKWRELGVSLPAAGA